VLGVSEVRGGKNDIPKHGSSGDIRIRKEKKRKKTSGGRKGKMVKFRHRNLKGTDSIERGKRRGGRAPDAVQLPGSNEKADFQGEKPVP